MISGDWYCLWGFDFPEIKIGDLMVRLSDCFTVPEGPVGLRTLEELRLRDFSQAVVAADGPCLQYGIVSCERLSELNRDGLSLSVDDEHVDRFILDCAGRAGWREKVAAYVRATGRKDPSSREGFASPRVGLDGLLEALSRRSAVLVGCHDSQVEGDEPDTVGLVTLADMNKHGLRAAIYPLFATLEGALADMIERRFSRDPWEWIMRLTNEESRARIVGYWKLSEREGVSVGATAGAMLSELLRAVAAEEDLYKALGYCSRTAFDKATKHLHRFRNLVMHPVRPLIGDGDDCSDLKHALAAGINLLKSA